MIIPEIKLTDEEMKTALGSYLATKGITVPVVKVEHNYHGLGRWAVTLKEPEEPAPASAEVDTPIPTATTEGPL